ncbi:RidA family protein [Pseudomonas sp. 39167]|uniref:RidA family protein n=1 Tax=Pseudomonas sp. 39167 TaxID=2967215 RepID=UPI002363BB31|nr:RidA family protein [Pseudomonas sp. 39167]MDD2034536.1 RidA family protein [Pseudomonas sp. 39167]
MKIIACENIAPPMGHYSLAVRQGDLIFLSGIIPEIEEGGAQAFEVQVRSVFTKCEAILTAAESDLQRVISCTAYIVGIENWELFNSVYAQLMGAHRPVRSVVPVPALHHGSSVELQVIASVL